MQQRILKPAFTAFAAILLFLLASLAAVAQSSDTPAPDYAAWEELAARAENALGDRAVADSELEALRAQIVVARAAFQQAQLSHQDRIGPLREQIAALGALPGEGETEAPEIAARRSELNERLAQWQAPLLAADEAFRRADSIIRAIDRVLRERQADALLTLWPTPLNPANWVAAANALFGVGGQLRAELVSAWSDPALRAERLADLPITLGMLAMALLLLLRGRHWMEQLTLRLLRAEGRSLSLNARELIAFVVSIAQILVPFLGLILFALAVSFARLTGPVIDALTEALVGAGLALVIARWLSLHVFPFLSDPAMPLRLEDDLRRRGRRIALFMGGVVALDLMIAPLFAPEVRTPAVLSVLLFPVLVLAALFLARMAKLLLLQTPLVVSDEEEVSISFFERMLPLLSRVLLVLAIAGALLGAVGYVMAAQQILFPAINSLALLAVMLILQRQLTALYELLAGRPASGSSEALVPALTGLVLAVVALPVLALIWGVRDTQLLEVWGHFREGFRLGETRISPANLMYFVLIFAIGYMMTRGLQSALTTSVLPKTSMEKGAQKAVTAGVGYVGIVVAALIAFSTAGIDLSGLAIVAGALSVGIGFGLQNIVSNFVSGVILLIERPVSEGDWVEVGPTMGTVSRISVRSTVIETFDRSEVIVPNSDLISGTVTNFTKSNKTGRVIIPVGVAYGTDTRRVEAILRELIEEQPIVALNPPPSVVFMSFGADALEFEVRAILRDVNFKLRVLSDMNHAIARRFHEEGIEIPFAQRDVWLRNPEVLTGGAAKPDTLAPAAAAGGAVLAAGALDNRPPPDPALEFESDSDTGDTADDSAEENG